MEEACATYIMLDDINKWLIQNEGFMKMTWTIILTEGPEWGHDIGSMHAGEVRRRGNNRGALQKPTR